MNMKQILFDNKVKLEYNNKSFKCEKKKKIYLYSRTVNNREKIKTGLLHGHLQEDKNHYILMVKNYMNIHNKHNENNKQN